MPLESTIVASIVRMAERNGWYATKLHGGPMQKAGLPDLLMLKDGKAVFLEVKRPGKGKASDATPLQQRRMEEIQRRGGCKCFVVHDVAEAESALVNGWTFCPPPSPKSAREFAVNPAPYGCERRTERRCRAT